jgi:hypothetical protein
MSSTIDPLEHVKHDFVIVVVQKPNAGILIIFLEWNCNPSDASENTACKKAMENTLSSRQTLKQEKWISIEAPQFKQLEPMVG